MKKIIVASGNKGKLREISEILKGKYEVIPMSEEYKNNFVILTDEDGNEKEFEHIDTLEDNGTVYLAFIPAELNLEEEAEVVILKIVEEDGEELLASVDDDEENLRLYNLFMDRLEDMYDAPEEDE